jgi:hypothetical protein
LHMKSDMNLLLYKSYSWVILLNEASKYCPTFVNICGEGVRGWSNVSLKTIERGQLLDNSVVVCKTFDIIVI